MNYQAELDRWLERAGEDPDLIAELREARQDEQAVSDRFYRHLAFGTGGLRGVIGAGTNRMNIYTVRPPRPWRTTSTPQTCPSPQPSPTTAASKGSCLPGRRPGCWRPTGSPPMSTPGWSPRRP